MVTLMQDADPHPAWENEHASARQSNVTEQERAMFRPSGVGTVWTNNVSPALKRLVGGGEVQNVGSRKGPSASMGSVYRIA